MHVGFIRQKTDYLSQGPRKGLHNTPGTIAPANICVYVSIYGDLSLRARLVLLRVGWGRCRSAVGVGQNGTSGSTHVAEAKHRVKELADGALDNECSARVSRDAVMIG